MKPGRSGRGGASILSGGGIDATLLMACAGNAMAAESRRGQEARRGPHRWLRACSEAAERQRLQLERAGAARAVMRES